MTAVHPAAPSALPAPPPAAAPAAARRAVPTALLAALLAAVLTPALGGCLVVRPHQRENLARRSMTADRDPGELRFGQHQTGSREGADGGTGQPGGGCGCN